MEMETHCRLQTPWAWCQNLNIGEGTNRLLGFQQTVTEVRGTKTLSTASTSVAYKVDAAGNLTSDGLKMFRYDAANRMDRVRVIKDGVCAQAVNPRVVGRWQWRSAGTGRAQQVFQIDVHEGEQLLCTISAYLACGELRRFASAINEHTQ